MNIEQYFATEGTKFEINKHDHVFQQGERSESLYLVVSGLLKAYYISIDGKENIKSFIKPGNIISSLSATYRDLPATFNLVALQDTVLVQCSFKHLLNQAQNSLPLATQFIDALLMLAMKKEQREYEFLMLPAEERYMHFCEREPELVEQLTQNDIARYLGITPVALSRIKRRLE